jgi:hypothetical protein
VNSYRAPLSFSCPPRNIKTPPIWWLTRVAMASRCSTSFLFRPAVHQPTAAAEQTTAPVPGSMSTSRFREALQQRENRWCSDESELEGRDTTNGKPPVIQLLFFSMLNLMLSQVPCLVRHLTGERIEVRGGWAIVCGGRRADQD